jgi:hypothetical protein
MYGEAARLPLWMNFVMSIKTLRGDIGGACAG